MQVGEKGQVTIPKAMREQLGILPGTEVGFEIDGDRLVVSKAPTSARGHAIVRRLRGTGDGHLSTDEILALTRGDD